MIADETATLRAVLQNGLVDTVLTPFRDPQTIRTLQWSEKQRREGLADPTNPNTFELLEHARSERWHEHTYGPITHDDTTFYWAVELARLVIPKGDIGILRTLEQVLFEHEGGYWPTNQFYWGSPYSVVPDVQNCEWYLQLYNLEGGIIPQRFNVQQAGAITRDNLPGMPYPELHDIQGLFYSAQNPNTSVKMLVPGQRILRFFFLTPPTTTYKWTVAGKLRASVQTTYSAEAAANARRFL